MVTVLDLHAMEGDVVNAGFTVLTDTGHVNVRAAVHCVVTHDGKLENVNLRPRVNHLFDRGLTLFHNDGLNPLFFPPQAFEGQFRTIHLARYAQCDLDLSHRDLAVHD